MKLSVNNNNYKRILLIFLHVSVSRLSLQLLSTHIENIKNDSLKIKLNILFNSFVLFILLFK